jgi:hypothetical protein
MKKLFVLFLLFASLAVADKNWNFNQPAAPIVEGTFVYTGFTGVFDNERVSTFLEN